MKDDELKEFLEKNAHLFKDLAECIQCPGCGKTTRPPFFNLGIKFHWAEGCELCYDKTKAEP